MKKLSRFEGYTGMKHLWMSISKFSALLLIFISFFVRFCMCHKNVVVRSISWVHSHSNLSEANTAVLAPIEFLRSEKEEIETLFSVSYDDASFHSRCIPVSLANFKLLHKLCVHWSIYQMTSFFILPPDFLCRRGRRMQETLQRAKPI